MNIYLLLQILAVFTVKAQVIADFTMSDTVGCNNLVVNFTNTSQGDNLQYLWDFGNGSTSTEENPRAVYDNLGIYTVTLIVSDGSNADTLILNNCIRVVQSPNVNFSTTSARIGCAPLTINFQVDIESGDAPLMQTFWDFGDGNTSTDLNPQHDFMGVADYSVSVYILDSNFCESSATLNNYITTTPKPQISFVADDNLSCLDTMTVNFTNTSSGATALNYRWQFGDGAVSTQEQPSHFYSGFNNYSVQLNVTDSYGCRDSLIKTDYINMQKLDVEINILDDYLCKNEPLSVENLTTGASSHQWIFSDGTTIYQALPDKFFTDTGQVDITYIAAMQNECSDTIHASVFVDRVTAKFETDLDYVCELPTQVNYHSLSEFATNWDWHIGLNYTSDHEDAEYILFQNGELWESRDFYITDTLIVTSAKGCRDTMIVDSSVYVSIPKVYFTPNDSSTYHSQMSGCAPISVNFQNKSTSFNTNDPIIGWHWDFGNGQTSIVENPGLTYDEAGEFEIRLTAESQSGCTNDYVAELKAGTSQEASFEYLGRDSICGSEIATFTDNSNDAELVNGWLWQFSDGNSSTAQNPEIQFVDTGYMDAVLTVFYNGCIGTSFSIDSVVYVKGPAGNMFSDFTCDAPLNYHFESDIAGTDQWVWDFGDDSYDSTAVSEVTHNYATSGDYQIRLLVENTATGCDLEREKYISVRQITAAFDVSLQNKCPFDTVWFNPAASVDAYPFSANTISGLYLWNFNDTSSVKFSYDSIGHAFTESGDFDVTLTVRAVNGCSDSFSQRVHVYNVAPDFSWDDSAGCAPFKVRFTDKSLADTVIADWLWTFGDGQTAINQNPEHTFINNNRYNVSLQIQDVLGCKNTITKSSIIYASKPYADFSAHNRQHCFGDSLVFINNSFSEGTTDYLWDFGDGNSSTQWQPKHVYSDTGYFDVTLYLKDSIGCDTSITKPDFSYVQSIPIVNFEVDQQGSFCYPKLIIYKDCTLSNDLVNWIWDFGDNTQVEHIQNPWHIYQLPGSYKVKLQAFTSLGCTDSLVKNDFIQINGPIATIQMEDSGCVNQEVHISMEHASGIDYFEWNTDDGESYFTNNFTKVYETPGIKKIYLTIGSDSLAVCEKFYTDSIVIPELQAGIQVSDTATCVHNEIEFSQNSIGNTTQNWYLNNQRLTDKASFIHLFDSSGQFEVKLQVTNQILCKDSASELITIYPLPVISLNSDTLICQYDTITIMADGGEIYNWHKDGIPIHIDTSAFTVAPNTQTKYVVEVIDSNQCRSSDSLTISVQPKPIQSIHVGDSLTLIIGENNDLEATIENADNFQWLPAKLFSCDVCESTTIFPLKSQYIYLTSTDNNGCFEITDSVFITVQEKYSLDIPSAFSPNNDGINDFITVKGWGIKQVLSLKIFNINGHLVYESTDKNPRWNGYSKNGKQPSGMYIYQVKVLSYDNHERTKQGYIYLLN